MNKFLVDGRTTLVTMVNSPDPAQVLELIEKGLEGGTDAFGMQFEAFYPDNFNKETITKIIKAMNGKPCYATNYRKKEETRTDEEIAEGLIMLAECGATLIDIMGDIFDKTHNQLSFDENAIKKQKELADKLHSSGVEVLMSTHTDEHISGEEMVKFVKAQKSRNVDIPKLVNYADTDEEEKENMIAGIKICSEFPEALVLSRGESTKVHRRCGPFFTNSMFLCVAEYNKHATFAQPLLEDAKKLVEIYK